MRTFVSRVARRFSVRQRALALFAVLMLVAALPTFAATPEPPMTVAEIITAGSGVISDFNLFPFITVGAVVGVAIYLFARIRRSAR